MLKKTVFYILCFMSLNQLRGMDAPDTSNDEELARSMQEEDEIRPRYSQDDELLALTMQREETNQGSSSAAYKRSDKGKERLNGATPLTVNRYTNESKRLAEIQKIKNLGLPCHYCDQYRYRPWVAWYRRYTSTSHLIIGASAFAAGIMGALAWNKFIK